MPKVRASSGTMGTTSLPISLSRLSVAMIRTIAMVVENSRFPPPSSWLSNAESAGTGRGSVRLRRCGRGPPSARRRARR